MRVIRTALWPLEQPSSDMGRGVFLDEAGAASLAGLTEGECVLLVEPNELQAEAVVHLVEVEGRHFWFAEIGDERTIKVIYSNDSNDSVSAPHPTEP